jgi:plasmid stabilization system protein ParE
MAYQIIWLPKAEQRFDEVILYLQKNWTEKEVINFIERTETVISLFPYFPACTGGLQKRIFTK